MSWLSDQWSNFTSAVKDIAGAIQFLAEQVWNDIVKPLAAELMGLLGFTGETVTTAYSLDMSLYGEEPWINPFKKIPYNRMKFNTEIYDEILNIFISGDHIRIKAMMARVDRLGYTPTITVKEDFVNKTKVTSILTGIVGEPITVIRVDVKFSDQESYAEQYLQDNSATTRYTYNSAARSLIGLDSPFLFYHLDPNKPFTRDDVDFGYDVNVVYSTYIMGIALARNALITVANTYANYLTMDTAVNALVNGNNTYKDTWIVNTAVNALATSTGYNKNILGNPIVLTVDNAIDAAAATPTDTETYSITVNTAEDSIAAIPGSSYAEGILIDTASDSSIPTAVLEDTYFEHTPVILANLIPANINTGKQYQALYTINSDISYPKIKYWWYYQLIDTETDPDYLALYQAAPILTPDSKTISLPIVPIKESGLWLDDSPTDPYTEDIARIIKKYGLKLSKLTAGFKEDNDPGANNGSDLKNIYLYWGVNVGKATTQAQIKYMYTFYKDYCYGFNKNLTPTEYIQLTDDLAFVNTWLDGTTYITQSKGRDEGYVMTYGVGTLALEARMFDLLIKYIEPDLADYEIAYNDSDPQVGLDKGYAFTAGPRYPTFPDVIGPYLERLKQALNTAKKQDQTSFTFSYANFNMSMSYGYATLTTKAGSIGTLGFYAYSATKVNYALTLQYQATPASYDELIIYDLTAFHLIKDGLNPPLFSATDFVGNDLTGTGITYNMRLPLTLGYLQELGIVDRQQLLYEAAAFSIYGLNKQHLDWYETGAWAAFFSGVLKIASIYYLFTSFGDATGAELLWAAAEAYATKLIIEAVIQRILLKNPDNAFAKILTVAVIAVAAVYGSPEFDLGMNVDTALLSVDALSQVDTTITDIELDRITEESAEILAIDKTNTKEIEAAAKEFDAAHPALLEHIKKVVTMQVQDPEQFYTRHLNRNMVEEVLDLDSFVDVKVLLAKAEAQNKSIINQST